MTKPNSKLVALVKESTAFRAYHLHEKDETTIGRNHESRDGTKYVNDIDIPSGYASKRHCKIVKSPETGELTIEDVGSKGGTFVNGRPLARGEKRRLSDRDVIVVAGFNIVIGDLHLPDIED